MRQLFTYDESGDIYESAPDIIFGAKEYLDFRISLIPMKVNGCAEIIIDEYYDLDRDYFVEKRYVLSGYLEIERYDFWKKPHEYTKVYWDLYNMNTMESRIVYKEKLLITGI